MSQDKEAFWNMHTPTTLMIAPGGDTHSLRPLNWLLERGCRVVFSDRTDPLPEGREGYSFVPFPYPRGGRIFPKLFGKNLGDRLFGLSARTTVIRLAALRRRIRPSVTHVHWVDDRAYYCAKAGLRPLVLTVWGSDINNHFLPDANGAARKRIGETLASADLILIDSADLHEKCIALAGRNVPTEVIIHGVNTDLFRPGYEAAAEEWRCRLSIPPAAAVLLSIRKWTSLYRHESILEAFARALPRLNSEAYLVFKIVKGNSMHGALYEKQLRDLTVKLGLCEMVRWMDEVPFDALPAVYSFADVILSYPSMDAFPVTFFEAAACECPVISCMLPAYSGTFAEEYFQMVSPDEPSELSDAIVKFVNEKRTASRDRLPELRRIVCQHYDERIVSGKLIDLYLQFLSPGKALTSIDRQSNSGSDQCLI